MARIHHALLRLLCCAALLPVLSLSSRTELGFVSIASLGILLLRVLLPWERVFSPMVTAWGASVALLPWVGTQTVLAISLVVLLSGPLFPRGNGRMAWAAPALAYLVGSALCESISAFSFISAVRLDDLSRVRDAARAFFEVQAPTWKLLSRVFLFAMCVDLFSGEIATRNRWIAGLRGGAFICALYALAQWVGVLPWSLSNQTPFWSSIHRVSGLATDPNALGVVMGLALWLVVSSAPRPQARSIVDGFWFVAVLLAGLVSGSRTFLVMLGVLACSLAWLHARRVCGLLVGAVVGLVCVVTVLDHTWGVVSVLQDARVLPEGLVRGISAMSLGRLHETFFSRRLFLGVSLEMWAQAPWYGVGADAYRHYVVPVGAKLGTLQNWSDNANNFYLGVLTELGSLGALAFFVSAVSRRVPASPERSLHVSALIMLATILVLGPHVDFPEVLLPVACLVGGATVAAVHGRLSHGYIVVVLCLAGIIGAMKRECGVYAWRATADGFERWLSPDAAVQLACDHETERAVLHIRAQYIPSREPLQVTVQGGEGSSNIVSLTSQDLRTVMLPCKPGQGETWIRIATRPAWSPARAWPAVSGDRRILGVIQTSGMLD